MGKDMKTFGEHCVKQKTTQLLPDRHRFPVLLELSMRMTAVNNVIVRNEGSPHALPSKLLLSSAHSGAPGYLSAWIQVEVTDAKEPRTFLRVHCKIELRGGVFSRTISRSIMAIWILIMQGLQEIFFSVLFFCLFIFSKYIILCISHHKL